jgi:hypothetical protein
MRTQRKILATVGVMTLSSLVKFEKWVADHGTIERRVLVICGESLEGPTFPRLIERMTSDIWR